MDLSFTFDTIINNLTKMQCDHMCLRTFSSSLPSPWWGLQTEHSTEDTQDPQKHLQACLSLVLFVNSLFWLKTDTFMTLWTMACKLLDTEFQPPQMPSPFLKYIFNFQYPTKISHPLSTLPWPCKTELSIMQSPLIKLFQ